MLPAQGLFSGTTSLRKGTKQVVEIDKLIGDDMDHVTLALHPAAAGKHPCAQGDATLPLEHLLPDDQICGGAFILDGHEDDAAGGARALPDEDQAGDRNPAAIAGAL